MRKMICTLAAALALGLPAAAQQRLVQVNAGKGLPEIGGIGITGRLVGRPNGTRWMLQGPHGRIAVNAATTIYRLQGRLIDKPKLRSGSIVTVLGRLEGPVLHAHEVLIARQ